MLPVCEKVPFKYLWWCIYQHRYFCSFVSFCAIIYDNKGADVLSTRGRTNNAILPPPVHETQKGARMSIVLDELHITNFLLKICRSSNGLIKRHHGSVFLSLLPCTI